MATSSGTGPIIYSIGKDSRDPNVNKTIEESMKELLEKFKETQSIIYVNIEKLVLDSHDKHRGRSRSKSREVSRSRSRSRSHSPHRRGKHHHHRHHGRGHRSPPHFTHRRPHHPFYHLGYHGYYPPYYYSSEVEENSCDITTGAETTEDTRGAEPCCRIEGRRHGRWFRKNSRSRSKSKGKKQGKGRPKKANNDQTKASEGQNVITIDEDEPKNVVSGEGLEKQFDGLNVSKAT